MRMVISFISPLIEWAIKYSPCTFLLFYCIFHFSMNALFLCLVGFLFGITIYIVLAAVHDIRSAKELRSFLAEYSNYDFERMEISQFFDGDELTRLKGMLRIYKDSLFHCYKPILRDKAVLKRFVEFHAFPSINGCSTVFLSSGTMNTDVRFKFKVFHELGHLSKAHYELKVMLYFALINCGGYVILVLFSVLRNSLAVSILAFIGIIVYILNIVYMKRNSMKKLETIADIFGLAMTRDERDEKELIAYLKKEKLVDAEMADYCSWWIESYVNTDSMKKPLMKFDSLKHRELLQVTLTDKAVNYYSLIEKFITPPIGAVVIFFVGIVIAALFASDFLANIPVWGLGLVTAVLVLCCFLFVRITGYFTMINNIILETRRPVEK